MRLALTFRPFTGSSNLVPKYWFYEFASAVKSSSLQTQQKRAEVFRVVSTASGNDTKLHTRIVSGLAFTKHDGVDSLHRILKVKYDCLNVRDILLVCVRVCVCACVCVIHCPLVKQRTN